MKKLGYWNGTGMPKSWLFELPSDLENDVRWVQFGNEDDVWRNSTCSSDMTDSTCVADTYGIMEIILQMENTTTIHTFLDELPDRPISGISV